jgi:hypothetical protein
MTTGPRVAHSKYSAIGISEGVPEYLAITMWDAPSKPLLEVRDTTLSRRT